MLRAVLSRFLLVASALGAVGCSQASEVLTCTRGVYEGEAWVRTRADLEGLRGYTQVAAGISVENPSPDVRTLSDLTCLEEVGGGFTLEWAAGLHSLDGLDSLTTVGGPLHIVWVHELEDVQGLSSLRHVGGQLAMAGVGGVTSVEPLRNLEVVGDLSLDLLPDLARMDFSGLEEIGGGLRFDEVGLTTLDGAPCVSSVGGFLIISDNEALTDIGGLRCITAVAGDLIIAGNASLTNIDGLESLVDLGGDLRVSDNPLLPDCEVLPLSQRLREHGWTGRPDVHDNGEGTCD